MVDEAVSLAYRTYYWCAAAWDAFEAVATMQYPYVRELAIGEVFLSFFLLILLTHCLFRSIECNKWMLDCLRAS